MNIMLYDNNLNLQCKNIKNSYYLSIRDNNTDIFKEIYLTESEFNVIIMCHGTLLLLFSFRFFSTS